MATFNHREILPGVDYKSFKEILEIEDRKGKQGEIEMLFNLFDTDRNGLVDIHEIFVSLVLLSESSMSYKILRSFKIFDFNGDGALSRYVKTNC